MERTSSNSSRRDKRPRFWAAFIASLCLLVLIAIGMLAIRPSFEFRVTNVEPSGMYDSTGSETLLVDLRLSNRSARLAYLNTKQARFRVLVDELNPALVEAEVPGFVNPHSFERITILVPAAAKNVELDLNYRFESWQMTMTRSLRLGGRGFLVRLLPKQVLTWLLPATGGQTTASWQRTEMRSDLITSLPNENKVRVATRD